MRKHVTALCLALSCLVLAACETTGGGSGHRSPYINSGYDPGRGGP